MNQWRGGGRRNRRRFKDSEEGSSSQSVGNYRRGNNKHPEGLRGRDIGLWYAQRSKKRFFDPDNDEQVENQTADIIRFKKKKQEQQNRKPIGSILLSESKKNTITKLLNETASMYPTTSVGTSNSYEHLEETDFKHEFLQHISGSIIKKLQSTTYDGCSYRTPKLDDLFLKELEQKISTPSYKKMQEFRDKLPSMKMKDEILDLINKNQVVVISGETGCGKTTQVAQFILDDYIKQGRGSECRVICTQPRRISAISVAERVAKERDERLGISAGYQIRMEKVSPRKRGSILYCTAGVLLKFMETDPSLSDASHLILDEIHERDVISDFLITVLRDVITYRSDIKVILMSATLNAEAFSKYYDGAPHINIPGFTFPVTDYYLEDVLQKTKFRFQSGRPWKRTPPEGEKWLKYRQDYIAPHIRKLEADNKDEDGSVLVFVPGFADIQGLSKLIQKYGEFPPLKYVIIPLHSQLPTIDQKQIFLPAPKGMRKIIISTNIAETSITIEDVTIVIDCGFIKMTNLDPNTGIETLKAEWVSCANASQRRGRAGRVKPGVCYHLFTRVRHLLLDKFLKPEVLRSSLEDVVLQLKMLQLGEAEPFLSRLMDPPESTSVRNSVTLLQRLGALDQDELLTPLGLNMAKLPVGAQCSKMILMGALFSCLDPVLSVAASLGYKEAFRLSLTPEDADKKKYELSKGTNSDHLVMHYAVRGFEQASNQYEFCKEYFLSMPILRILLDIRKQLANMLHDMKFIESPDPRAPSSNYNSKNISLVKAVVASGLYPNVAIALGARGKRFRSTTSEIMKMHPKSVVQQLRQSPSPLLVYQVRMKSVGLLIHDGTCIFPLPVIFFGDQFKREYTNQDGDSFNGISVNGTMRFLCTESTASVVEQLRERLNQVLETKVSNPGFVKWTSQTPEVKVLRAIMELITSEDMEDLDLSDYDDM